MYERRSIWGIGEYIYALRKYTFISLVKGIKLNKNKLANLIFYAKSRFPWGAGDLEVWWNLFLWK